MSCKYFFKNKTYNSEQELDYELLRLMTIQEDLVDLVFSKKQYSDTSNANHQLLIDAHNKASQLQDAELHKTGIRYEDFSEDIPIEFDPEQYKNYVSVTQLMKFVEIRDKNGEIKQLFPIFKPDNYWKNMEQFLLDIPEGIKKGFIDQQFLEALTGEKGVNPENVIIQRNELDKVRERMEAYWKLQAVVGDVAHKLIRIGIEIAFTHDSMVSEAALASAIKNFKHGAANSYDKHPVLSKLSSVENVLQSVEKNNNGYSIVSPDTNLDEVIQSVAKVVYNIQQNIRNKYKNHPRVYTELKVTGEHILDKLSPKTVFGQIDLLVIDNDNNIGIYDYKCSPKVYSEFDSAKRKTFRYQLAMYRRLLKQLGINHAREIDLNIIPIQFENFYFAKDDPSKNVKQHITTTGFSISKELSRNTSFEIIPELDEEQNLNVVLQTPKLVQDSNEIEQNVNTFISTIAPDWFEFRDTENEEKINEKVSVFLEKNGGIQETNDEGSKKFVFNYSQIGKILNGKDESEVVEQIKEIWRKSRGQGAARASKIKDEIITAKKEHSKYVHRSVGNIKDVDHGSFEYVEKMLGKYVEPEWEVVSASHSGINKVISDLLDAHGMLLFRNIYTNTIDVVKCANSRLDETVLLGPKHQRRKYILGTFMTDDAQLADSRNTPLASTEGNLELMEALAVLNYIPNTLFKLGNRIGEIKVINSDGFKGIGGLSAPSDQLVNNFRKLFAFAKLKDCQIALSNDQNGAVKLSTHYELVSKELESIKKKTVNQSGYRYLSEEILNLYDANNWSILNNINNEEKLLQLLNLKENLERIYTNLKGKPITDIDYTMHPEVKIYNEVLLAIAELQNVQITQQIGKSPKIFKDFRTIFSKGLQGLYTDNPGTLESQNLNNLTYLTERAYQNVRTTTANFNGKLRKALKKLKKNRSNLLKYTVGNAASIYTVFYDQNAKNNGKLQLRRLDDSNLSTEELEFLNFAVRKFAYDRGVINDITIVNPDGTFNEEKFQEAYSLYQEDVLQVPLARASFGSTIASSGGLLKGTQFMFRQLLPSNIKNYVTGKFYELLDPREDENKRSQKEKAMTGQIFEMINRVKNSYQKDLREKLLQTYNPETKEIENNTDLYEINLEKLLLYSDFSLAMEKELNKIFPSLKAILLSLSLQGTIQNTQFTNDMEYAQNYIKNKILGLPLEDMDKFGTVALLARELASTTSKLALAFNPQQLYQVIDGIWKDILLIIQKPDVDLPENSAFTKTNLTESFMWILQDVVHVGDSISLGEALNNVYGLNDRDINVFTDRINSDTAGIYNFWSLGFRFSSRPDYYNRMTIFGAQMRKDGSFRAHKMVDNQLVYDWTLDDRFYAYANKLYDHKDYAKQKALYLAMAREFVIEGATDSEGKLFTINNDENPTPLPRAYTTKQSESMKALADKIYGYYTHEKKSMIQSYTLGALFMQMHTYWSAKKNQYLAGHGYSQSGEFVQLEEVLPDGQIQKYWEDEEGLPTTTDTGVPYLVWTGRPHEGIIITLSKLFNDWKGLTDVDGSIMKDEDGNELKGWDYMVNKNFGVNADPKLKALYIANMKKLCYDLNMWIMLGLIISPALMNSVREYLRKHKNTTFDQALTNTMFILSAKMLKSSSDDFNILKSLGGQVVDWDPFSLSMAKQLMTNTQILFDTDKDSFDFFVKMSSATRNTGNIWDYVKYETTGRFVGQSKK